MTMIFETIWLGCELAQDSGTVLSMQQPLSFCDSFRVLSYIPTLLWVCDYFGESTAGTCGWVSEAIYVMQLYSAMTVQT